MEDAIFLFIIFIDVFVLLIYPMTQVLKEHLWFNTYNSKFLSYKSNYIFFHSSLAIINLLELLYLLIFLLILHSLKTLLLLFLI